MREISVDSFTLLEFMARNGKKTDNKIVYSGSAQVAAEKIGLKHRDPKKMSEYTKGLKDAGIVGFDPRTKSWAINLDSMQDAFIHGVGGPVSELIILNEKNEVVDPELSTAIARELFTRLSLVQQEARGTFIKTTQEKESIDREKHQKEVEFLKNAIAKQEAENLVAQRNAQAVKEKTVALEQQIADLMRKVAPLEAGDEIREVIRDFFRRRVDSGAGVSTSSQKAS